MNNQKKTTLTYIIKEYKIPEKESIFQRIKNFFEPEPKFPSSIDIRSWIHSLNGKIPADILEGTVFNFYIKLQGYIERKGYDEPTLYKKAFISRAVFSNIRQIGFNDYVPSKQTVLRLCLALGLSVFEAQDLLKIVGYALSNDLVEDKIVAWCLENDISDIITIDEMIFQETGRQYLLKK